MGSQRAAQVTRESKEGKLLKPFSEGDQFILEHLLAGMRLAIVGIVLSMQGLRLLPDGFQLFLGQGARPGVFQVFQHRTSPGHQSLKFVLSRAWTLSKRLVEIRGA